MRVRTGAGRLSGDDGIKVIDEPALSEVPDDLYPRDKRGRITAKGGATEWIHRQSGTAQLLPRLIARRTRGPLFLTDRKAPAGTPTLDVCPETGRARLSYRRAEEIFEENTRLLATPNVRPSRLPTPPETSPVVVTVSDTTRR
ncbi:hypothetical protein AB0I10_31700 [Streptomyces sp. NPDC050636]|uniref:hypothetical protein n=1 Tax=Streptomyces sp. NPDC050636 TaxID=3154510 RepID=UPI003432B3B1